MSDAGDTHLGLNVYAYNTVAMGLYDSLGFRVAERFRALPR